MGSTKTDRNMEGWLYLIRFNRLGLQYSRKRYFSLTDNCLKCYKMIPTSDSEEPVRSAILDCCIRITDNGRESINRKVIFIFTLCNASNHSDQLKLGASSPEEAARWISSLQDAALQECPNPAKRKWPSLRRLGGSTRDHKTSMELSIWSSMHMEAMTSDVIAPSPWKIFGCHNGLRLFEEAKDWDSHRKHRDDHPAIMAVGVLDGSSEAIFQTLMSLGPSRSEWDFCFYRGSVVEHFDGHTDIIQKQLCNDWVPWGMKRRDLLLQRYWRREEDGTYGGGYVITPVNQGKQSLVKHMLAIDWKFWKLYPRLSSGRSITICMLERVAALRELFRSKAGNYAAGFSSGDLIRDDGLLQSEQEDIKTEVQCPVKMRKIEEVVQIEDQVEVLASGRPSLMGMNDAADEFFDVFDQADYENFGNEWPYGSSSEEHYLNKYQPKLPSAASLVKKLHDLAVQKKGYTDLQDLTREESISCCYGATLHKDPSSTLPCSWAAADASSFLIRGENYFQDHQKIKAKGTLMQMVGADWLRSDRREDDLGGRPGSIVQRSAERGGPEFFFIVNIQVPGKTKYTLALYYMTKTPLKDNPLLQKFVNGDDTFRNSRFKLIPYISKGSWIVKQSVGKKACLVGQALEVHYFRGKNYLELEIDVGSSTVARGVINLVLGYLNNLVIELAFVIQGNTREELPEVLLGTCQINHLDASKSVPVHP
ncbi:Protein ENHANCED DISEASE RESISTANCE 2 [Morella rubra]|uniref:Protein ENHANCED DISEASE RESISTANCE 2 n=1 Tax=Morella rubra TaxID=262757 RepID=A0A6A1UHC1_9ROSI|nr:Protein ENHANCED DISEASE RESISTANCE 2 [Morella rubra]